MLPTVSKQKDLQRILLTCNEQNLLSSLLEKSFKYWTIEFYSLAQGTVSSGWSMPTGKFTAAVAPEHLGNTARSYNYALLIKTKCGIRMLQNSPPALKRTDFTSI